MLTVGVRKQTMNLTKKSRKQVSLHCTGSHILLLKHSGLTIDKEFESIVNTLQKGGKTDTQLSYMSIFQASLTLEPLPSV